MDLYLKQLAWVEEKNGIKIDCSLEVAIHPANSNTILLIIPGVDGSLNGFQNKYLSIAENIHSKHGVAVIRISNPFISSFHWESNIRHILEFINDNLLEISGNIESDIRIMAHSAGASVVAQIAHEYLNITKILLINPAAKLGPQRIEEGLRLFKGDKYILVGSKDPSLNDLYKLGIEVIDDADHNFSGKSLDIFKEAAGKYLF